MQRGILAAAGDQSEVTFIFEDDKCEPKDAVSAFKKLVEFDQVNFIIGPGCGSPQEVIAPLAKDNATLVIVPSAASRDLFSRSGQYLFNVQYSLEDESTFMGEKLNELGFKKVALISYRNAFSETHVRAFKESFSGEIVEAVLPEATSDVSSEVAKIKAAQVDVIYSPDIAFFFANGLAKLRQYAITVPVYSSYVAELPVVRSLVPEVIYSFPGDLAGTEGAVFELSKQSAEIIADVAVECRGVATCAQRKLSALQSFDQFGVYQRPIILKQIKNGVAVEI
jgi:ABC-type branched-subunit amino acid transport system substrate-binding protein